MNNASTGQQPLARPLAPDQIAAACELHKELKQWKMSDAALVRLRDAVPGFEPPASLLKCVTVNSLYGTQVFAIVRMGEHVTNVMAAQQTALAAPALVEKIAKLPGRAGERPRRFVSFAAKFCHFFVDEEQYPIYDEAARFTLKHHLGPTSHPPQTHPYQTFYEDLTRLRQAAGIGGPGRELDRYLWITGMYEKWRKERTKERKSVNFELSAFFNNPGDLAQTLHRMLPSTLERAFALT